MNLELNETLPHSTRLTLFAEVILPVPVSGTFTYRIPLEMNNLVQIGSRVVVQFGKRRIVTGIIYGLHENPPKKYQAKPILELLDEMPLVSQYQLRLWEWTAQYYLCTLGEVMNVALPAGLKISSESHIQLHPYFETAENQEFSLTENEEKLVSALKTEQTLTFEQACEILNKSNIYPILKKLIQKEIILIYEEVKDKYKPKIAKKIRIRREWAKQERMTELLDSLKGKPKQEDVMLKYLTQINLNDLERENPKGVEKSELLASGISNSSLETLIKYGILEEFEVIVPRFSSQKSSNAAVDLAPFQQKSVQEVLALFELKTAVLLHGITGSGKTEMYIELIKQVLEGGSQVLFLLPEIALTTQIVARLGKFFGNKMGVYHSKFSDNERVEIWKGILQGDYPLVVGVRSSIFLPFTNLGLIIVDEEHDGSYKQFDPAPRYNSRDLAMVLAGMHHSKVLLGSATPSVESYYLAQKGKYGLVKTTERYGEAQLPEIQLVNTKIEKEQKTMKGHFSSALLQEIEKRLADKEQLILFQNRRGYAPQLSCDECSWTPQCENCSVSLTYHLASNELRCHYCGFRETPPASCRHCGSVRIKTVGFGTEKIEEELKLILPETAIQRMDLDTTRSKYGHQIIIEDFAQRKIDILIGTQMVTKGLDFDAVGFVGVFDIDRLIHFPDFRSFERTFQLTTQVSGRAGRRNKKGLVFVQTGNPQHPLLQKILDHDYEGFYETEIREREKNYFPPFVRLIKLTIKNLDETICIEASQKLLEKLVPALGQERVLGPEMPIIDKIRNQFLRVINIKLEREKIDLKKAKDLIESIVREVLEGKSYKQLVIAVDVDPM